MCYIGYEVDIMKSKSDSMKRKIKARCEDCLYYDCDENGEYYCQASLDEDEAVAFRLTGGDCPYFRFYDEYKSVRKQN